MLILEQHLAEAQWKLSYAHAFRSWYNPTTKEFVNVVGSSSHADTVLRNPDAFGINPQAVARFEKAGRAEEPELKRLAIDNGWIRVAGQDRNNPDRGMVFEGNDLRQIQRLVKAFFQDQSGSLQNVMIKVPGNEYRILGNDAVKAFAMRGELPEPFKIAA